MRLALHMDADDRENARVDLIFQVDLIFVFHARASWFRADIVYIQLMVGTVAFGLAITATLRAMFDSMLFTLINLLLFVLAILTLLGTIWYFVLQLRSHLIKLRDSLGQLVTLFFLL